jgi:hypothetical protein
MRRAPEKQTERQLPIKAETPAIFPPARTINLDPADWYRATWRKLEPLPRPEPPVFKQKDCAARVARVTVSRREPLVKWAWEKAGVPVVPSGEEARFWLEAMTRAATDVKPKELALFLERQPLTLSLTVTEIKGRIQKKARYLAPAIVAPLAALLPLPDLVALLLSPDLVGSWESPYEASVLKDHVQTCLIAGFARYVLPFLHADDRQRIGATLPLVSDPNDWPKSWNVRLLPIEWRLAALLGRAAEVKDLVSRLQPDQVAGLTWPPVRLIAHDLVFGLDSAEGVQQELRRLDLPLRTPGHVRAWLAHTEFGALDYIRDSIRACTDREEAEGLLEVFCLVEAPEAAPLMLELQQQSRVPGPARRWLGEHVDLAIVGLLPVAAEKGTLAQAALEHLREVVRRGGEAILAGGLQRLPLEDAARVRREVFEKGAVSLVPFDEGQPPWWNSCVLESLGERPGKPPPWADPARLPLLPLGGQCLHETQVSELLVALRKSSLEAPLPLVRMVKQQAEPVGLEAFAWRLFELWLAESAPAEGKWALGAVGLLGGDASALKLIPLIRDWPGQEFHQRAVWGLECLRALGSDTALMALHSIAQKVKLKGLQGKARTFMKEIATERGLTAHQLEDRIVPDLGLDERGSRTFDYGPRRFRLVFGPNLKPMLRDEAGKLTSSPRRGNAGDDPGKVDVVAREWKLLKKQVSATVKVQVKRLEQAMLSKRRWSAEEFDRLLVHHPFLFNLVRLLLWGDYDAGGQLLRAFRVTEDRTRVDVSDTTVPPAGAAVGVVHPLELTDEERGKWGEVFSDYEIIQPFPQIGRRTHALLAGEEKQTLLTRFSGRAVPAMIFNGILKSHDWMQNRLGTGRFGLGHYKRYPEADLTAVIREETNGTTLRIDSAFFVRGFPEDGDTADLRKALPLGAVDPIVLSEVLGILAVLASKGT